MELKDYIEDLKALLLLEIGDGWLKDITDREFEKFFNWASMTSVYCLSLNQKTTLIGHYTEPLHTGNAFRGYVVGLGKGPK